MAPSATPAGPSDEVLYQQLDGGIGLITLNRPEAMNAITTALAEQLEARLREAAGQGNVILIRGAGEHFCTGGDFAHVQAIRGDRVELRQLFERFHSACSVIGELPVPVVCSVRGNAMAGGFELIQACDIAIVAENARLADNHTNFGMVPGGGGSQRLPRLVGARRALGHILTGDRISGSEAVEWGLAYACVPEVELDDASLDLARSLAAKDSAALAKSKRLVRNGLELSLTAGLATEIDVIVDHVAGSGGEAAIENFKER